MKSTTALSAPRPAANPLGLRYDPEAFARFSEKTARFMGTGRFLVGQTIVVVLWLVLNSVAIGLRWDPYPFILLNLAFSVQSTYMAPLILFAEYRQEQRDRAEIERDREMAARTEADADYLARELAAIRLALQRLGGIDPNEPDTDHVDPNDYAGT